MMQWMKPTAKGRAGWIAWVATRSEALRAVIASYKLDPWTIYVWRKTGQHVRTTGVFQPDGDGVVWCDAVDLNDHALVRFRVRADELIVAEDN